MTWYAWFILGFMLGCVTANVVVYFAYKMRDSP